MRHFAEQRREERRDTAADTAGMGPSNSRGTPRRQLPPLPHLSFKNPLDLLRAGVKLQTGEVEDLKELLTDAVLAYADGLDGLISRTNADRAEAEIWSTITRAEAATIAQPIVDLGQKYAQFAFIARQMARSYTGMKIGLITVPRFFETMAFYAQHGGFMLWSRQYAQTQYAQAAQAPAS